MTKFNMSLIKKIIVPFFQMEKEKEYINIVGAKARNNMLGHGLV